jgi:hypothetical protein
MDDVSFDQLITALQTGAHVRRAGDRFDPPGGTRARGVR